MTPRHDSHQPKSRPLSGDELADLEEQFDECDADGERRGDIKTHTQAPQGRICEIDRERSFGRIETNDGRLIYFHRNSVLGRPFEELSVGATVRFVEEAGDLGPQASTVHA